MAALIIKILASLGTLVFFIWVPGMDVSELYKRRPKATIAAAVFGFFLTYMTISPIYNNYSPVVRGWLAEIRTTPRETTAPPTTSPQERETTVTTATLGAESLFDSNNSNLTSASEQAIADLLDQLGNFQEIEAIEVTGHTDNRGTAEYNLELSRRRASAVADMLRAAYPSVQIRAFAAGESRPVATNNSVEGRQLNRRVEVQVTAKRID